MLDIRERLGAWIPQVQGQYINMDWNPTNKGFGAQCWDLAAHWSNFLGLPIINTGNTATKSGRWPGWAGNMVDCFPQTAAIAAAYTLHAPSEPGQSGDICVWGDSNKVWYPATHVAVLVSDKSSWLQVMSLNSTPSRADNPYPEWTSGPTTLQSLPRQGLIGFIRPRVGGLAAQSSTTPTPTASKEDDDMLYIATAPEENGKIWIGNGLHRRHIPSPQVLAHYRNVASVMNIYKDGEIQQWPADVLGQDIGGLVQLVPDLLLDRETARADVGGNTSLRAVLGYFDTHITSLMNAIAATAAGDGATVDEIKAALKQVIDDADLLTADDVVKVDVTVEGSK